MRRGGLRGGWRCAALVLALFGFAAPALVPVRAEAHGEREWPTYPDEGPKTAQHYVLVPASEVLAERPQAVEGGELFVVKKREEPTRRQKRLLRRAERHARKAAELRKKSGVDDKLYVVAAPRARCDTGAPKVVVAQGGPTRIVIKGHPGKKKDRVVRIEGLDAAREVVVDLAAIQADIDRQVAGALRAAERAQSGTGRAVELSVEKAMRTVAKVVRSSEAIARTLERALRDGVIDEEERAAIGEAARAVGRDD
ncbi:MAG TPA: hypothetical protein VIK91_08635 [Nannocystis sp.]